LRHYYTGLFQRAARLSDARGGGSLTLLARIPRQSSKPALIQNPDIVLETFEKEVKQVWRGRFILKEMHDGN